MFIKNSEDLLTFLTEQKAAGVDLSSVTLTVGVETFDEDMGTSYFDVYPSEVEIIDNELRFIIDNELRFE